ncbi:hypothetical protein ACA910_006175 [Epithemia clementina (nom. ined.)]
MWSVLLAPALAVFLDSVVDDATAAATTSSAVLKDGIAKYLSNAGNVASKAGANHQHYIQQDVYPRQDESPVSTFSLDHWGSEACDSEGNDTGSTSFIAELSGPDYLLERIRSHPNGYVSPKVAWQSKSIATTTTLNHFGASGTNGTLQQYSNARPTGKQNEGLWDLVVLQDVGPNELILSIPDEYLLTVAMTPAEGSDSPRQDKTTQQGHHVSFCELVRALSEREGQLTTGGTINTSDQFGEARRTFLDYIHTRLHLQLKSKAIHQQHNFLPPHMWSAAGQDALRTLLGEGEEGKPSLPPYQVFDSRANRQYSERQKLEQYCPDVNSELTMAAHNWIRKHGKPWRKAPRIEGTDSSELYNETLDFQMVDLIPLCDVLAVRYDDQGKQRTNVIITVQPGTQYHGNKGHPSGSSWVSMKSSHFIPAGSSLSTLAHNHQTTAASKSFAKTSQENEQPDGMAEIFQEFGIVQQDFPQHWIFATPDDERNSFSFTLDCRGSTHLNRELQFTWHHGADQYAKVNGELYNEGMRTQLLSYLQMQIKRLYQHAIHYSDTKSIWAKDIPEREWNSIVAYRKALLLAFESLEDFLDGSAYQEVDDNQDDAAEQSLRWYVSTGGGRYSSLDREYDDYHRETCDEQAQVDYVVENFDEIDEVQSPYQNIIFAQDPKNGNICFELDGIYQICSSYRPHYHEMVVHYTARFLPEVKRVLFVGGGDAMLLHEILQYADSLELVVGLELDQQVTRKSFHHFGVQPHFDNPAVQWWYGDAAKSLLMLPSEYFGTFDMVLVDLSETVMSFLVTDEMDILTALSLLLQPNGIFVKNEMYFEKLNQIFPHSVQLNYYDVPLICKQCLALGSFATNFMETDLTYHDNVRTLFAPLDEMDHDLAIVRDYRWNATAKPYCSEQYNHDGSQKHQKQNRLQQYQSPGILLIIEAEDILDAQKLSSGVMLQEVIVSAIRTSGLLKIVSSFTLTDGDQVAIVVLEECYIVARAWPELEYCALDVHMWSSFNLMESVKDELLVALRSPSSSSYRIVAGGMFGVNTWKDDAARRGPKFQNCQPVESKPSTQGTKRLPKTRDGNLRNDDDNAVEITTAERRFLDEYLKESLNVWLQPQKARDHIVATVICGLETQACPSLESLQSIFDDASIEGTVIPVWTCPNLSTARTGKIGDENSTVVGFACESQILSMLLNRVRNIRETYAVPGISLVILDVTAPFAIAPIVHKIFGSFQSRNFLFLPQKVVALAPGLSTSKSGVLSWRRIFIDHFRPLFPREPGFASHVTFKNYESTFEAFTFVSGDPHYATKLKQINTNIEKRVHMAWRIQHVGGVELRYQEDFTPSQFFSASDYDQRASHDQWISQEPLGYQTLFQMEIPLAGNDQPFVLPYEHLKTTLVGALRATAAGDIDYTLHPREFQNIGDGSVIVTAFSGHDVEGGTIVCLWNGRSHVDINLFTFEENEEFASAFIEAFTNGFQRSLRVVLRDEIPRGNGRVVNFGSDIYSMQSRKTPYWASHLQ